MDIKVSNIEGVKELTDLLNKSQRDDLVKKFENLSYYPLNVFNALCDKRTSEKYASLNLFDYVTEYCDNSAILMKGIVFVETVLMLSDLLDEKAPITIEIGDIKYHLDTSRDLRVLYFCALKEKGTLPFLASDTDFFRELSSKRRKDKKKTIDSALTVSFFQRDELTRLSETSNEMYTKIFQSLKAEKAEIRSLVQINQDFLQQGLGKLRQDFPNFHEVIDFIEGDLALYGRGIHQDVVKFEPILLGGAPGIGKTEFARRVSELLKVPFTFMDMSASSSPRILNGADNTWKDSKPGLIFNQLYEGDVANPIIFLDEIDKVPQGRSEGYALTALYALLETSSNNAFKDEFFPLPINTKYVNFIAAGNDISKIPEPLLTRFNYFDVKKPEGTQLRAIAHSVMHNLLHKVLPAEHGFSEQLSDDILDKIEQDNISPRHMLRMFKSGFKNALKNGRDHLVLEDVAHFSTTQTFSYTM